MFTTRGGLRGAKVGRQRARRGARLDAGVVELSGELGGNAWAGTLQSSLGYRRGREVGFRDSSETHTHTLAASAKSK